MIPVFGTAAVLIAPSSPLLASGYVPGNPLGAQHFNWYLYHLTAELNNVLSATGESYNASDDTQVITSIKALIGNSVVVSGTTSYSMPAIGYTRFLVAVPTGSASAVFNVPSAASIIGSAITIVNITSSGSGSGLVKVVANGSDVWESTGSPTMWIGSPWASITFEAVAAGRLKVMAGSPVPDQGVDTGGAQAGYALGKLIHLPLGNTTGRGTSITPVAVASWTSAVQVAGSYGVPVGAKGVRVRVQVNPFATVASSVSSLTVAFSDNNSNAPGNYTSHKLVTGHNAYATGTGLPTFQLPWYEIDIPLNSSGQFYMETYTSTQCTVTSSVVYFAVVGYYMGD
jgi:hypothetical protein